MTPGFAEDSPGPSIGSDSHVTVDPWADLRMLEYSQRLLLGRRNVGATPRQPDTATALTLAAVAGGAQASGRPVRGLALGQRADFVILDGRQPLLRGLPAAAALSAHQFALGGRGIDEVWVSGRRAVAGGVHDRRDQTTSAFAVLRRAAGTS